jgi:hypothetical protein
MAFWLAVGFGPIAHAQEGHPSDVATQEATTRFREGLHFHDLGREEEARLKFAQAYAVLRTPNILFNLARSEQLTGHSLEALGHFKAYVRDTDPKITPVDRDTAKLHIADLIPKVGHVAVEAPVGARITVDGVEAPGEAPFVEALDVEVGKHTVVARVGEATKSVDVSPGMGETAAAKLAFDTAAVGSVTPVGPANPENGTKPPPGGPDQPAHPTSSGAKTATVIALAGGALVGIGLGVGFAVAASNESGNITADQQGMGSASCFNSILPRCMQLAQATSSRNNDTGLETGFFVAGGVLALGAVAAWVFWPAGSKDGKVAWRLVPVVTSAGATLGLSGRF